MIKLELYNLLYIKIDTENREYLYGVRDHFSAYVDGYRFMPQYGMGRWDGKICLFNNGTRTLPYGLLTDLIRYTKKEFPKEELSISPDISKIFHCIDNPSITEELSKSKPLRPYQTDCILTVLKYGRGIIKVATAGGKSLIIAHIINELKKINKINKSLIIVPTTNLVEQFRLDLIDYGFNESRIGRLYERYKELDKEILISTWQSLMNRHEILKNYSCIIGDECHIHKAKEVREIMLNSKNAIIRVGFTGTLPVSKLDMWQIQSYIGPVLKEYTAADLSKLGYISKCTINVINIKYKEKFKGEYNDIKDNVFKNEYRLNYIKNIVKKLDSNVLILVGKIEKEGELLKNYLENSDSGKEIIFIWGSTKVSDRDYWRSELEKRKNIALIATYPIFSMGVNIPSLKYIILASPFKSNIRVLQSVGRALRMHEDKPDGAQIFDLIDLVKFLNSHGDKRIKYYVKEGFDIIETCEVENNGNI